MAIVLTHRAQDSTDLESGNPRLDYDVEQRPLVNDILSTWGAKICF